MGTCAGKSKSTPKTNDGGAMNYTEQQTHSAVGEGKQTNSDSIVVGGLGSREIPGERPLQYVGVPGGPALPEMGGGDQKQSTSNQRKTEKSAGCFHGCS